MTDVELETAKNSIINSFVFNFEQKTQVMTLKLQDYADSYPDRTSSPKNGLDIM